MKQQATSNKQQATSNKQLLTKLLMVLLFLSLVNCQKEDTHNEPAANQVEDQQGLKVLMTNWKHFSEDNITASKHISKLQEEKSLSRNTTSEEYGFIIDTSRVQVIEQQDFTTYAFYIMRPELNSNIVENYVYKEYDNGDYAQYILTYNCVINEDGVTIYDAQSLQVTPINDSSLLSRSGCEVQFVGTFDETVCEIRFRCTGSNPGHEIGDDSCPCGITVDCIPAGMSCYTTTLAEWSETCPGGHPDNGPPDPNNPGGGLPTTTTTYIPQGTPTISYPVQHPAFYSIIECINGTGTSIDPNDQTTLSPIMLFAMQSMQIDWKPMGIYLNQNNNCSEEAQAFSIKLIESYHLVPEMDKECQAEKVVSFTSQTDTPIVNIITNTFFGNNTYNLQFEDVNIDPELDANADTLPPDGMVFNQNTFATIRFDNSYLENATDLSIVMTTAHEYVHVFLIYLHTTGDLLNYYPSYINLSIAFQSFENNPTDDNSELLEAAMHDVYDDFLGWITQSVYTYALNNNIEGATEGYCNKLVIGAHQDTDAFQALTPAQQTEYSTITSNEEHGTEQAKGTTCD